MTENKPLVQNAVVEQPSVLVPEQMIVEVPSKLPEITATEEPKKEDVDIKQQQDVTRQEVMQDQDQDQDQDGQSSSPQSSPPQSQAVTKKKQKSPRKIKPVGMFPSGRVSKMDPVKKLRLDKKRVTNMIKNRCISIGSHFRNLFTFEDSIPISDMGDVRFSECVLVSQVGELEANDSVRIIDWLPSSSTLLISKTGKISDTIFAEVSPATIALANPCIPSTSTS